MNEAVNWMRDEAVNCEKRERVGKSIARELLEIDESTTESLNLAIAISKFIGGKFGDLVGSDMEDGMIGHVTKIKENAFNVRILLVEIAEKLGIKE